MSPLPAEPPSRRLLVSIGLLAAAAVLAGVIGLVTHQRHRITGAAPVSALGVVSGSSGQASGPSPGAASTGALSTHSTELGAQGPGTTAPVRVSIPRLRLSAAPIPAGLGPDHRSLALLPSARSVVWWAYGAAPGARHGTVLLAGHISWDGQVGALSRIGSLRIGDRVTVTRQDGVEVHYAVTGRRQVPKTALGDLGLFAANGTPRLVLVTCGGAYDAGRHSYADNVVVQARPM